MTRNDILQVVLKHIDLNVHDFDKNAMDTSRSMAEYGASSLDIVEIVSGSMRELKIKIPRTELSKLRNVDELVDLFHRVKANAA